MAKVFISHSSLDCEFVENEIIALLNDNDIDTWYSKRHIKTAEQWVESIEKGLESCDWFLVAVSRTSRNAKWVKKEMVWATEHRYGKIVPVLIDDSKLPLILAGIQYVDFRQVTDEAQRKLLAVWRKKPSTRTGASVSSSPLVPVGDVITNSIGMQFRRIEPGTFVMGDGSDQHEVTITEPFLLGIYPVTQAEYKSVMDENRSRFVGDRLPVEGVNWFPDTIDFCNRLSHREGLPPYYEKIGGEHVTIRGGEGYRLPTEAEWEYACRAGTTTEFCCGDEPNELRNYGWFKDNSGQGTHPRRRTHPVGLKKPNAWGIYDMHGNVWEWCWDWYGDYPKTRVEGPIGPDSGISRIYRGGSYGDIAERCRSACRDRDRPTYRQKNLGFRVSRSFPQSGEVRMIRFA